MRRAARIDQFQDFGTGPHRQAWAPALTRGDLARGAVPAEGFGRDAEQRSELRRAHEGGQMGRVVVFVGHSVGAAASSA